MEAETAEVLTITEAAERAGVHRSTIRRALDRDEFPDAYQDQDAPRQPWLIPVSNLDEAGYGATDRSTGARDGADSGVTRSTNGSTPQAAPGTAVVSVEMLSGLFQQVADAEGRAAKASAQVAFLEERLGQLEDQEDDGHQEQFEQIRDQLEQLREQIADDRGREQLEHQQAAQGQRLDQIQGQLQELAEDQAERGSWAVPRPMLWGAAASVIVLVAVVATTLVVGLS